MSKRKATALLVALLCGLSVAGVAWAMFSASYAINWDVIAGGGGHASSGGYAVDGSVGQPAVGPLSGGSYTLVGGFWPGIGAETPTPTPTGTLLPTSTPTATPTPTPTTTGSPPPTSTPTATLTPTPTATGSPPPTSTPTATPTGVACENILPHGDFEAGLRPPWGAVGETQVTTVQAHTGTYSVRLGGADNVGGELFAGVELPPDATSITLSYWWYVESSDQDLNADIMVVVLGDEGGEINIETITNSSPRNAWHQSTFDMGSYAGQFSGVIFHAETNGWSPTSFYVDDVRVQICGASQRAYLPIVLKSYP